MRTIQFILAGTLVCTLASCSNQAEEPVSAFNLEEAKAMIAETNQKFMEAVDNGDSAMAATLYHSNAIIMPDNAEQVSGSDAILAFLGMMDNIGLKLVSTSVWGNEDVVVEEGVYEVTDTSGNSLDHGKYIVLWKEQDGQWKLYRDIWCSNVPLPMPEPASEEGAED
jgi:ketosteroid isomerase-like protein